LALKTLKIEDLVVRLSFAQFEPEVTGERIRYKVAASQANGRGGGSQRARRKGLHPPDKAAFMAEVVVERGMARGATPET